MSEIACRWDVSAIEYHTASPVTVLGFISKPLQASSGEARNIIDTRL